MRYRNYRLFFAGQAISQTGSWMQRIALSWFVLQLTHSAFAVGVMAFAQFLPFTVFGLFGGVLADRLNARRTVIATQVAQLATAVALAWIALAHIAQPWMLYTIGFINGLVLVLDIPSRQQLTYRMVGPRELPNAIALNSSLFNASRIFGPAAAGVVYGFAGAGVSFLVNAISFLAVVLSLLAMRTRDFYTLETFERPEILRGTLEGLKYVWRQPQMMIVLALTVVIGMFSFNFNVTLPVLAYATLHTNAATYGILSAVFGAGALVGALAAASLGRASMKVLIAGSLLFTGAELALAPVRSPVVAGTLLFLIGAGFTAWSANANATMQLAAPDRLRGRIIAIYFYAFIGTGPFAGLLAGWLCARGGTQLAFVVAGIAGLAGTTAAAVRLYKRRPVRTVPALQSVPQRHAA
jgi:MFS family permease